MKLFGTLTRPSLAVVQPLEFVTTMQDNKNPLRSPRHIRILRWDRKMFRQEFKSHTLEKEVNSALHLGWELGSVTGAGMGMEFILFWCKTEEPLKTPFQIWSIEKAASRVKRAPSSEPALAG